MCAELRETVSATCRDFLTRNCPCNNRSISKKEATTLHDDTRDLPEYSQAIAQMEKYIERYRRVHRAGRHRQRTVEISLANLELISEAQRLSSAAANRERSPAQIKANAGTASRLHEEGQRAARATSQIKEPRRPRNL